MMEFISIPVVVAIITMGIYKLFELIIRKKERLTIIEKMGDKFDPSMIASQFSFEMKSFGRSAFSTLKIACLFLGVGLGLLVGFFIAINTIEFYIADNDNWQNTQAVGVIYGASVLLFGGLGLLVAFLIEIKNSKH